MKLKEKIELYHALYAFLKTDGIQHLEEKTVHFEDTKKLILNLPDPIVSKIDEHFIVSFAWEILEGYLEKLYWLVYNSKPLHIYGRLLLGKDEAIYVENIKPEIDRYLKEEDINYVKVHHSNYAKYTLKSSRSNKVITHTDTGLELSFVIFDKKETNPVIYPLNREAHVIVGADDNKQLNDVTETMMKSIHKNYKAQEVQFVIGTQYPEMFNRYSLSIYENQMITDDVGQLIKTLKHLEQVMIERFNLFATHQARDIKIYNFKQTNKKDMLPYIVILIDDIEIDDSSIKEKYHDLVLRITQKSRTAGIHVIILTTKPYQNISNQFGYIIPNRLAFRLSQTYDSMALLGTKDACHLRSDEYLCETYKHQIKKG
jgi:hypothetical protein